MNEYVVKCHFASGSGDAMGSVSLISTSDLNKQEFLDRLSSSVASDGVLQGSGVVVNLKWVQLIEIRQLPNEDQEHGND